MSTKPYAGTRYAGLQKEQVFDLLCVEAPLHLRVNGESFTTTMRTPGNDEALARGLLFTEGIMGDAFAPMTFTAIGDPESGTTARLDIDVPPEALQKPVEGRRSLLSTSSCGVCGTRDPADIEIFGPRIEIPSDRRLSIGLVPEIIEKMCERQTLFAKSGGSHAAAAFTVSGELLSVHEDIGRHNAVDKVVGDLIEQRRLDDVQSLTVSGRVSYEIVYKAYRAGIPFLMAVSAPSSMAVETAERFGMTIIGFCRDQRMTVYSNANNTVNE